MGRAAMSRKAESNLDHARLLDLPSLEGRVHSKRLRAAFLADAAFAVAQPLGHAQKTYVLVLA